MILYIINGNDPLYCTDPYGMMNALYSYTDCDIFRKYNPKNGRPFEYLKMLDDERVRLIRSDVIRITDVGFSKINLRDINADMHIPIISRQQCEKINGYDVSFYYLRTYLKDYREPSVFPHQVVCEFFKDKFQEHRASHIILICRDEHLRIGDDYGEYERPYKDEDGETKYIHKKYKKSVNRVFELTRLEKLNINRNIKTDLFDVINELSPLSNLIIQAGD